MRPNDCEVQHYYFILEDIRNHELIYSKLHYIMFWCHIYSDEQIISTILSTNLPIIIFKSSQKYLKYLSFSFLLNIIKLFFLKFKV